MQEDHRVASLVPSGASRQSNSRVRTVHFRGEGYHAFLNLASPAAITEDDPPSLRFDLVRTLFYHAWSDRATGYTEQGVGNLNWKLSERRAFEHAPEVQSYSLSFGPGCCSGESSGASRPHPYRRTATKSDGNSLDERYLHRNYARNFAHHLPMEQERGAYRRRQLSDVHDTRDLKCGQRHNILSNRDEQRQRLH